MRITGGQARGIPIKTPKRGELRPATDYLREAIYSSLGHDRCEDACVLDAFAGTGAYGLEALSRGASHCTFLEQNRAAIASLEENCAAVGKALSRQPDSISTLIQRDFFRHDLRSGQRYDLVFVDPPYPIWPEKGEEILAICFEVLKPDGRLVAEAPGAFEPELPAGSQLIRRLAKGPKQPSALIIGGITV
ncbi:MAG: RsmD family RNA methyltransferase [Verrucomicrobiota bacterium]